MKEALAYLIGLTAAEIITVSLASIWGIIFYIALLIAVIIYAAIVNDQVRQHLFLSLALVPLTRIISLSMPLANIPQVWWYPIIYIPLFLAAFQVMQLMGLEINQIGIHLKRIKPQIFIAFTGVVFGVAEYFILVEEAEATGQILQETWLLSVFFLLSCTGFVEEVIFRGVLQLAAVRVFGWWGVVYVSYLFGVIHWIHNSMLDIAFVFVVALFFGWVVKRTESLLGVIFSHGIANVVLFMVMPVLI
ncbi:lysostaphin resistance A-like protein [Chloroflexota bacterium]